LDAPGLEPVPEVVGVIGLVGEQALRWREGFE